MHLYKVTITVVSLLLLLCTAGEAKKKNKYKSSSDPSTRAKTKTKWSTSSDVGPNGAHALVATEEHGYYVKRTFLPYNASAGIGATTLRSPPYLGIPIAWFSCEGATCTTGNTGAISGSSNAISDGFLCDDDCAAPYEPICGKTPSELAVFYNKCKLNVAKCRTHGLWQDVPYEQCQKTYPKELEYAEGKFRSSPFYKDSKATVEVGSEESKEDSVLAVMADTLNTIHDKVASATNPAAVGSNDSSSDNPAEATTVQNLIQLSH